MVGLLSWSLRTRDFANCAKQVKRPKFAGFLNIDGQNLSGHYNPGFPEAARQMMRQWII
jgi:hypothetical protein